MANKTLAPFDFYCWHVDDVYVACLCIKEGEGTARPGVYTEYFHI